MQIYVQYTSDNSKQYNTSYFVIQEYNSLQYNLI